MSLLRRLRTAILPRPFAKDNNNMTIFSNGPVPADEPTQIALEIVLAAGYKFDDRRVTRLANNGPGPAKGITLEFESGPAVTVGMLYHHPQRISRGYELIDSWSWRRRQMGMCCMVR